MWQEDPLMDHIAVKTMGNLDKGVMKITTIEVIRPSQPHEGTKILLMEIWEYMETTTTANLH